MILDGNAHVGPTVYQDFEFDPTIDALSAAMDRAGIDEAVVAPLKPPSLDFDSANARLATRTSDHEELHAIGRIDPRIDQAVRHAKRALDDYGLPAFKLHPYEETFPIHAPYVDSVLEVAAAHDAPVWVSGGHAGLSHPLQVRSVAQSFPDVTFVLSHGCHLDISGLSIADALRLADGTENTVFELSGVYRHDFIQDIVAEVGADRVAFGSNAPYFHPTVELSRVTESALSEEAKETVLAGTISSLL
jgi:predicted TIM-barrel fold metal-dependent hydrolase